ARPIVYLVFPCKRGNRIRRARAGRVQSVRVEYGLRQMDPMTAQVPDNPSLLDRMMSDLTRCDQLYRPTNYWAYYEQHFVPELKRQGLRDFRRRRRSVLTSFGGTDLRPRGRVEVSASVPASERIAAALNRLVDSFPGVPLGVWGSESDLFTKYFY